MSLLHRLPTAPPDTEALRDLVDAADLFDAAGAQLCRAIERCRDEGWAWPDIAEVLDVETKTASRLFRRLRVSNGAVKTVGHPSRACTL